MTNPSKFPIIPAGFFGIVLGLAGLGAGWRSAHRIWDMPGIIGELLMFAAIAVWVILLALFVAKWIFRRDAARAELEHPVQCCFVGLIGVTTMLVGGVLLPYSRDAALLLFGLGSLSALAFALWRTGLLWRGDRDPAANTAILYLPTVAASFVAAIVLGALGYADWGKMAFGAGFFSWLAIESVLWHRLYTAPQLALPLRPSLGIQLAPPTVGAVAYVSVMGGPPDMLLYGLMGYGLLQALLLLRLLPWIGEQSFVPAYWGFSFGATAIANAPLRVLEHGGGGPLAELAPYLFVAANIAIGVIAMGTVRLLFLGRMLSAPPPVKS